MEKVDLIPKGKDGSLKLNLADLAALKNKKTVNDDPKSTVDQPYFEKVKSSMSEYMQKVFST